MGGACYCLLVHDWIAVQNVAENIRRHSINDNIIYFVVLFFYSLFF